VKEGLCFCAVEVGRGDGGSREQRALKRVEVGCGCGGVRLVAAMARCWGLDWLPAAAAAAAAAATEERCRSDIL